VVMVTELSYLWSFVVKSFQIISLFIWFPRWSVRARENCRQVFAGMALFYDIMALNLKASLNKLTFLAFRGSNNFFMLKNMRNFGWFW
jgi:hypothetical protein